MTPSGWPDAYTVTHYRERVARAFRRLLELDEASVVDAVARLAAPFCRDSPFPGVFHGRPPDQAAVAFCVARRDPDDMLGLVVPRQPHTEELLTSNSELAHYAD